MKKYIKLCVITWGLLVMSSCQDNFLDVNEDPNNPSEATTELVLPAGQMSAAFVMGDQFMILGSLWSQQWTQSVGANQYASIDNYNISETSYDRAYSELYAGSLNDLNFVSKTAETNEDWNYFLISEVMTAYVYEVLVDFYDKIPYSEALEGVDKTRPAFDDGEAIYDDLITRIDNALSKDLSASTSREVGSEDLVFGGDMDQWIRFANTLKLKMYLRQTEVNASKAQSGVEALFNSGAEFLDSDAEIATFSDVQTFRNPFYATQVSSDGNGRGYVDIAASATLLNYLANNNDPRLEEIYNKPVNGGDYVGLDQGDFNNQNFTTAKDLSQPNISPTQPVVFLSKAESKFLQAEAVLRYGVSGDDQALYEAGIDASLNKLLGSADAGEDLYGAGGPYAYDHTLESIITQKWISFANYEGTEGYFEYLRTGFPDFFTTPPNNVTGGVYPKRLPYPSSEQNNNGDNLSAIGGQKQVIERVWWDPS